MDKFERWLVDQIDEAERNMKASQDSDRVFSLSYSFGRDLLLKVLKAYRAFRSRR